MRAINCGCRCLKGSLFVLEVVPSIVNRVNNLYFLAYKVQQTFFVAAVKTWIREQRDTSFLLTKSYSYWNVFYLVKMHNLRVVSVLSLRSLWWLRWLRKKSSAIGAIIAIISKPPSRDCRHFHMIAMIATIAELFFLSAMTAIEAIIWKPGFK